MKHTRIFFSATLLLAGFLHAAQPAAAAHQEAPKTHAAAAVPDPGPIIEAASYMNGYYQAAITYVAAVEQAHVVDYVNAVHDAQVADYVHAVQAAQAQSHPAPLSASPAPSGGACGGATNGADQYIHRESGGDPYIVNGGGHAASPQEAGRAFGCYQILPSTWASSCSDITTYDPASQARCASRLPDSAWAL